MNHIFVTYGDAGYEKAKARIISQAEHTGEFQWCKSYGRGDLSPELLESDVIKQKRGGGLWTWKPDVILSTMEACEDDDIIVYCDAGCSVYKSSEWKKYWRKLENHDLIAQRIFQQTEKWTRREILDLFSGNGKNWEKCFQYQATPIFKNTAFTRQFVREWRDLIISKPMLVMDVTPKERSSQRPSFIENRHDQAVFSALIYKYLADAESRNKIHTQWEHIEDYDPFFSQAIRTTRLRQGQAETPKVKLIKMIKRIIKDYLFKPFYYAPLQIWYSRK